MLAESLKEDLEKSQTEIDKLIMNNNSLLNENEELNKKILNNLQSGDIDTMIKNLSNAEKEIKNIETELRRLQN